MKLIPLTQGKFAQVDDEDYDFINQFKWCTSKGKKTYYAVMADNRTLVLMHRVILKLTAGDKILVDHIDHNGLNNQRNNIRIATVQQNNANSLSHPNSTSKYIGVSRRKVKSCTFWIAQIKSENGKMHAKYFPYTPEGEIKAAQYRDIKAKERYGEFANLNFPLHKSE